MMYARKTQTVLQTDKNSVAYLCQRFVSCSQLIHKGESLPAVSYKINKLQFVFFMHKTIPCYFSLSHVIIFAENIHFLFIKSSFQCRLNFTPRHLCGGAVWVCLLMVTAGVLMYTQYLMSVWGPLSLWIVILLIHRDSNYNQLPIRIQSVRWDKYLHSLSNIKPKCQSDGVDIIFACQKLELFVHRSVIL